jgi:hypothetical protein
MNRLALARAARVTGCDVSRIVAERIASAWIKLIQNERSIVIETRRLHPSVVEELARHGLRPLPSSSPEFLRDAVRDLYLYEIRRLRSELLAGRIPKVDYANHVIELRRRYPLLSLPLERWVEK